MQYYGQTKQTITWVNLNSWDTYRIDNEVRACGSCLSKTPFVVLTKERAAVLVCSTIVHPVAR